MYIIINIFTLYALRFLLNFFYQLLFSNKLLIISSCCFFFCTTIYLTKLLMMYVIYKVYDYSTLVDKKFRFTEHK